MAPGTVVIPVEMKRTVNLRDMSATSPLPPTSQESQTKKIMMDLQQEKKRLQMMQQSNSTGNLGNVGIKPPSKPFSHQNQQLDSSQQMNINQRNALQQANSSSFGYFIPQASSFGNLILPVIPRVGPNE